VTLGLPRQQVRVTLTGGVEGWNEETDDSSAIKTWLAAQLDIDKSRIRLLYVNAGSLIIDFEIFEVPITSAPTSDGGTSFPTTAAPVGVPVIISPPGEDTKPWIIAVAVAVGFSFVGVFVVVFYCTQEEKTAQGASAMAEKPVDVEKPEAQQMQEEAQTGQMTEAPRAAEDTLPYGEETGN